ncbi:hypothetical protein AYI68_g7135, partial [Smittium mucronatum]
MFRVFSDPASLNAATSAHL